MTKPTVSEKLPNSADKKLGQILLAQKLITVDQLAEALFTQQKIRTKDQQALKLGQVLVLQKMISLPQLQNALRQQTQKAAANTEILKAAKIQVDQAKAKAQAQAARPERGKLRNSFWQRISDAVKRK